MFDASRAAAASADSPSIGGAGAKFPVPPKPGASPGPPGAGPNVDGPNVDGPNVEFTAGFPGDGAPPSAALPNGAGNPSD